MLDPHVADPGVPAQPPVDPVPSVGAVGGHAEDGEVGDLRVVVDVEADVALVRVVDVAHDVLRFGVRVELRVPHAGAADRDVADAPLVVLPAGRVGGEDLLFLPPLAGRDPDAADETVLVVRHGPLESRGVIDVVVRDGTVRGDGGAAGRLAHRRRHLLQIDEVDDVERRRVGGVALQPEPGTGRVGLRQQRVRLVKQPPGVGLR
jgi:hypothetical protein